MGCENLFRGGGKGGPYRYNKAGLEEVKPWSGPFVIIGRESSKILGGKKKIRAISKEG